MIYLNTYDLMKQWGGVWGTNFLVEWVDATLYCD